MSNSIFKQRERVIITQQHLDELKQSFGGAKIKFENQTQRIEFFNVVNTAWVKGEESGWKKAIGFVMNLIESNPYGFDPVKGKTFYDESTLRIYSDLRKRLKTNNWSVPECLIKLSKQSEKSLGKGVSSRSRKPRGSR